MSKGNSIVVSVHPHGRFVEGIIGAALTPKPGTIMQHQAATALVGGRQTWELYNADADGGRPKGPIIVLTEDHLQGKVMTDAYAAGERAFGYIPRAGDELNLLLGDVAGTGTGSDFTKGDILIIDDGTGEMVHTSGSPETEVAQMKETLTDLAADTLGWVEWTGY